MALGGFHSLASRTWGLGSHHHKHTTSVGITHEILRGPQGRAKVRCISKPNPVLRIEIYIDRRIVELAINPGKLKIHRRYDMLAER